MKLLYITNNPKIAKIADSNGADWVFVDLEILGKDSRQGNLDTVISRHTIEDVKRVKVVLKKAKLLARINPIYPGSKKEIDQVIQNGAEIVMLPYFNTPSEAAEFIGLIAGRAKACLLVETPAAAKEIDAILELPGIDYVYIGLNDLHLGYKMKFMFEPLVNGTVETLCRKISSKGIPYGFGGIARVGEGTLPAEMIIAEHYRLGSSMVILSRSFCDSTKTDDLQEIKTTFAKGIKDIRDFEATLSGKPSSFFTQNQVKVQQKVTEILKFKS